MAANIQIVSWNLLNFGASDIETAIAYGPGLYNYIANLVVKTDADIICLQEIIHSTAAFNMQYLLDAVHAVSAGILSATAWGGVCIGAFTDLGGGNYEG